VAVRADVSLRNILGTWRSTEQRILEKETSWNRLFLEKPRVAQIFRKFLAFYTTRKSIIVFIKACH
jgi:hypothetical protein